MRHLQLKQAAQALPNLPLQEGAKSTPVLQERAKPTPFSSCRRGLSSHLLSGFRRRSSPRLFSGWRRESSSRFSSTCRTGSSSSLIPYSMRDTHKHASLLQDAAYPIPPLPLQKETKPTSSLQL